MKSAFYLFGSILLLLFILSAIGVLNTNLGGLFGDKNVVVVPPRQRDVTLIDFVGHPGHGHHGGGHGHHGGGHGHHGGGWSAGAGGHGAHRNRRLPAGADRSANDRDRVGTKRLCAVADVRGGSLKTRGRRRMH